MAHAFILSIARLKKLLNLRGLIGIKNSFLTNTANT